MANLRAIYKNLADTATVTVSSTASSSVTAANLKLDPKSLVWRTSTATTDIAVANIIVNFGTTLTSVGGVILAFTNLSADTKIRIRGYTGTAPGHSGTVDVPTITTPGSLQFDTGWVYSMQPQNLGMWEWGVAPLGPTAYADKRNYHRVWLANTPPVNSIAIEIADPYNTDRYVEVSRLIVGSYWSPKYNTSFGVEAQTNDTSETVRTESGDMYTNVGVQYNSMTFDLRYMDARDRTEFNRLVKTAGKRNAVFVSLFPDNSDDYGKEHLYQMYGKLSNIGGIEHPIFEFYSTKVEMEEV